MSNSTFNPLSKATSLTRRAALTGAAALPLVAATARAASAGGHGGKAPMPRSRSFTLGDLSVTTLLDASAARTGAKGIFGAAASDEEFAQVSRDNFISDDALQFYFTPTLVDTGSELVLFDTGLGQGGIVTALAEAGVSPDAIDVVVITHMHGDHIGGLLSDGAPTFANARYVTGSREHNYWMGVDAGNRTGDLAKTVFAPLAERTSFIDDGVSVAPGITAMAGFGHTPGHMT